MLRRSLLPAKPELFAPVLCAVGLFVLAYVYLDFNKLYALRYGSDLGTFLQTVSNLGHGSSWNYGEWRPHLQVHDSWILLSLVPFVALVPRAETLIVAQICIVALAAIPLTAFASEIGVPMRTANLLGIAYLLSPSAQGIVYDNFSENVFVPILAFSAAIAVRRRSFWWALFLAQLLMGVKEDEILFVGWFAAACLLFWDRRIGAAVLALAAVNAGLFWGYEHLAAAQSRTPHYGLLVGDVSGKLTLAALLLAPFAFSPLMAGRWLLLSVPLLAEIVFAQRGVYDPSRIGTHYAAPLLACTAIAAVFGVLRAPKFGPWLLPCAVIVLLFFNDSVVRLGRWPFIVDSAAYAKAVAIRETDKPVLLRRGDEGVWAVAAVNPLVRLELRPDPHFVACPAYNTNAAAFFASIGIGSNLPVQLCGGVPVGR